MVADFCGAAREWLATDPENVVAVHCKAGKGRTGVMISALLLALRICPSAHDALRLFGEQRTYDGKGVTIPSQARTVFYFEQWLARGLPRELWIATPTYRVQRVRFVTVPNFDVGVTGCDPYFVVSVSTRELVNCPCWDLRSHLKKLPHYKTKVGLVDIDVSRYDLFVRGNARMTFFDKGEQGCVLQGAATHASNCAARCILAAPLRRLLSCRRPHARDKFPHCIRG